MALLESGVGGGILCAEHRLPSLLPALLRPTASAGPSSPPLFSSLLADKWSSEEVAAWLEALGLGEYRDIFVRHDIQGSELILLERRDLKVQLHCAS